MMNYGKAERDKAGVRATEGEWGGRGGEQRAGWGCGEGYSNGVDWKE